MLTLLRIVVLARDSSAATCFAHTTKKINIFMAVIRTIAKRLGAKRHTSFLTTCVRLNNFFPDVQVVRNYKAKMIAVKVTNPERKDMTRLRVDSDDY